MDEAADTMRGRAPGSRTKFWLLLYVERRYLTAALAGATFLVLLGLGYLDPVGLRNAVAASDPVETLFQALVTAIVTGVTLVVTITQLVLSQELGAVDDQRERMEGALEFRRDVEESLDAPISPPEPAGFLRAILDVAEKRADTLADAVAESRDDDLRRRVDDYVDALTENADRVSAGLDDAQFGTFEVLFTALDFNYSWKLYESRRLRNEHADALTDEARDAFDDLTDVLSTFGLAREHVKTLYFEWELTNLSRAMLYAAVPALFVSMAGVLYLDDSATVTGATLGVDNLVWVVSAATTVALVPFFLLLAYVLRIVTVAQRTLAIGPFVLRETNRTEDVEW
ncbi:MAG: hypothetical protein ABEJ78_07925 [Haloferacaceae archaeon]